VQSCSSRTCSAVLVAAALILLRTPNQSTRRIRHAMAIINRVLLAIFLSALFLPGGAFAQRSANGGGATSAFKCQGKLTRKVLEGALSTVQSRYQALTVVRASFTQDSYLAALDTAESSQGTVVFRKPGRMKWSYKTPEQQEFVLKDRTVWFYQPEIKQVLIDEISEVVLTDLPVAFLMGVGKLREGFVLKGGCASSEGTVLELDPKQSAQGAEAPAQKENSLKGIRLLVSPEGLPAGVQVFDVVGNITTIALQALKESSEVGESEFLVEYPAGTDVNDRRTKGRG